MSEMCVALLVAVATLCWVGVLAAPRPVRELDVVDKSARLFQDKGKCGYKVVDPKEATSIGEVVCAVNGECVQLKSSWWVDGEKRTFQSGCAHLKNPQQGRQLDVNTADRWQSSADLHCSFKLSKLEVAGVEIEEVICSPDSDCNQVTYEVSVNGQKHKFRSGCVHLRRRCNV